MTSTVSSYDKKNYPKATNTVVAAGVLAYIGGLFLLISVFSPYWVQSFEEAFSNFKNMGLWQYCFNKYKFPYFQYNHDFHLCHSIYSQEYYVIREWLLPIWLLFSEAFMTIALIASLVNQTLLAMIVTRYPKYEVLRYEWMLATTAAILSTAISMLTLLTLVIFFVKYESRTWLMYPKFNFLSWSYWFAFVAFWLHVAATRLLYKEARRGYEARKESKSLLTRMTESQHTPHSGTLHHGYI